MGHGAYREEHPLLPMLSHLAHVVSMFVLAFTGFYIHSPFFSGGMRSMRTLHFIFMYVVLIAFAARLYFLLFGRSANVKGARERVWDLKSFLPQNENRHQLLETVKYYFFLRKTHPVSAKYNPLQKLAYTAMGALLVVQAYTGFAIYGVTDDWKVFAAGTALVGGLMAMRVLHYLVMWAFILITMVHVYLATAEDIEALPLMFWWKEAPAPAHTPPSDQQAA